MKIDRNKIVEIISKMLDNPDENGIYPTSKAYDELEEYIETARIDALAWMYVEAYLAKENFTTLAMEDILERSMEDLGKGNRHSGVGGGTV